MKIYHPLLLQIGGFIVVDSALQFVKYLEILGGELTAARWHAVVFFRVIVIDIC